MRHKKIQKRQVEADKIYNSRLITKLMNYIMVNGKKKIAEKIIDDAFKIISAKDKKPLEVFELAIENVGPKQEVKPRRVGGASYQIPIEVNPDRRVSLAIRWILESAEKKPNKEFHTFAEKLASELLDASVNLGEAIKKREAVQRMAQANRAFAHFRW